MCFLYHSLEPALKDTDGNYFIDRDGDDFAHVLVSNTGCSWAMSACVADLALRRHTCAQGGFAKVNKCLCRHFGRVED